MDWIDLAVILLGVAGCGVLHLTALALARRDNAEARQEQSEQGSKGSLSKGFHEEVNK